MRKAFVMDPFSRSVAVVLSVVHALVGLYYASPLYVFKAPTSPQGRVPSYILFQSEAVVHFYGILLFLAAFWVGYVAMMNKCTGRVVSAAILTLFLVRFYQIIGTFITVERWFPPSWLAPTGLVAITALLWVWTKYNVRNTE